MVLLVTVLNVFELSDKSVKLQCQSVSESVMQGILLQECRLLEF